MVTSDDSDDQLYKKHQDLCSKLNLEPEIIATSWEIFQSINKNFGLEGDPIHWLGCSVYVASQRIETPTVDSTSVVRGNCINLTSLLRHSNLSFAHFFNNITKWAEMSQLPEEFHTKVLHLRSTFSVAYNTFKKFHPMFIEVFVPPSALEIEQSQHKSRKTRPVPCTSYKMFEFVWNLFLVLKAEQSSYGTKLIESYHLLDACMDLMFKNAFLAQRRDLLNPSFEALPSDWSHPNFVVPQEAPCLIRRFCKSDSVLTDALHTKVYVLKDLIMKLIRDKVLIGDPNNMTGFLDADNFDQNFKSITNAYETHLLSKGDFDERIFLAEYRRRMLEKEQSAIWTSGVNSLPFSEPGDTSTFDSPRIGVTPKGFSTPLTGRSYLGPREVETTPLNSDASVLQRLTRLHNILSVRPPGPTEALIQVFQYFPTSSQEQTCSCLKHDPPSCGFDVSVPVHDARVSLLLDAHQVHVGKAPCPSRYFPTSSQEQTCSCLKHDPPSCGFDVSVPVHDARVSLLLDAHQVHVGKAPCPSRSCQKNPLPIIENILSDFGDKFVMCYKANNLQLEVDATMKLQDCVILFYKFVETILQNERSIRNDVTALIEKELFYQCMFACSLEIVLFCHSAPTKFPWVLDILEIEAVHFVKVIELIVRSKDQLSREMIKHLNRIEETCMESLVWRSNSEIWIAVAKSGQDIPKFEDTALPGHILYNSGQNDSAANRSTDSCLSPAPSAAERFQSPVSQNVSRNLFPTGIQAGQSLLQKHTHLMILDKDGNRKLIPIVDSDRQNYEFSQHSDTNNTHLALPRRTGSLAIIFRKFYNLAGVRMEHLCEKLRIVDVELKRKIWTVFEDSVRHTDLIRDRHLDQLLMCAVYVICKVCGKPFLFTDIMKFYREQPQSDNSVYRDVLIHSSYVKEDGTVVQEKRGDLICFYNSKYVDVMQAYAVRFQNSARQSNADTLLSPLPAGKRHQVSPSIYVGDNVFVKPLESPNLNMGASYNYFFSRSPSKDLRNINRAINHSGITGKKRKLLIEGEMDQRIAKRKIEVLVEERRSQNAE